MGKDLENQIPLTNYNIKNGSTIHLVALPADIMIIFVHLEAMGEISVEVDGDDTLEIVKLKIWDEIGIAPEE